MMKHGTSCQQNIQLAISGTIAKFNQAQIRVKQISLIK